MLLCGCSTLRSVPPPGLTKAHEITVFTDGFHSGLVLDKQSLPADIDPRSGDEPASYPQLSLHFGEELWTAGIDNSMRHAVGLVFVPGRGVVQSDHTRSGLMDVPGLRHPYLREWTFAVTQAGMVRLIAELKGQWMTGIVMPRMAGETSTLYLSPRSWSALYNCHDFTVDLLRAAGLDLRGRWVYLAGGLATDLDEASSELEAAGITVIGPPVPAPIGVPGGVGASPAVSHHGARP